MLDKIKGDILEQCRLDTKDYNKVKEIVGVVESLSFKDKIDISNALVLLEETSSILLETYKQTSLDSSIVSEQLNMLTEVKDVMFSKDFGSVIHRDHVLESINILTEVSVIRGSDLYLYTTTKEHFENVLNDMDKKIVLEGASIEWTEEIALETALARTQSEFDLAFTEFSMGPDDLDALTESATKLVNLANRYDRLLLSKYDTSVLEADHHTEVKKSGSVVSSSKTNRASSGQSTIKKAAVKLDEGARKTTSKLRKKGSDAKTVGTIAAKAGGRFTSLVANTVGKLNSMNKEQRMEAILQGGMRRRVSNLLRNAILVGAVSAVNPALGLITLLTSATIRNRSDDRLKQEILSEYTGELKLVREKMRDAESAGDRKKKYELMRIETHLEQNIERINAPGRTNRPKLKKG